ncbi:MAG: adenosylmethionine--8-amino-7-oxononanoate transaminase [Crocinitomicaceae bacterium]|nr:adenosylmethionine--8-amino-7-oxononanoate transaminase [Crocinitomicaceae bacterium]
MENFFEDDLRYVWHPFTQAKTALPPVAVVKAHGAYLYTQDGKQLIDANSSWWTNIHGHGNSRIANAIYSQFKEIDHVIFAGVTHPMAVKLAKRLVQLSNQHFARAFFSDNGSTAVEVALKMCFQFWYNMGSPRKRVLALEGAYHGDTFGAMSVGQRGHFNKPFEHLFFEVDFLPFPDENNQDEILAKADKLLSSGEFACFIFEPLIQGAAGMRMYDAALLNKFIEIAKAYQVMTIADEVMTGFFRTGTLFACDQLHYKPDIMCLSKGLTGGVLPLGVTMATSTLYDAFLHDETAKALLHGHSFTGNAIACAAACTSLDILMDAETQEKIFQLTTWQQHFADKLKSRQVFHDVRVCGTILAAALPCEQTDYFAEIRNRAYLYFLEHGVLLRPLGNVLFVNPPYCINEVDLDKIYSLFISFAQEIARTK